MTTFSRRGLSALGLSALALPALAQPAFPSRAINLVVSWAPGGSTDFVGRVLAEQMGKELPGQVVVDNRAGASGTIGHASVARARPDGYTLLLGVNSTYAMAAHLFPNRGYDDARDFTGIGRVASTPIFLCVTNSLGVRDIAGFIAAARARPLSYGSSGVGSSAHLASELFLRMAGISVQNVTYRGGAPAVAALISNEVQMAFVDAVTALPLMQGGQITAIGVSSLARNALAPSVPTIAESGAAFAGYECTTQFSLLAPAGMPEGITRRLHSAMAASLANAELQARLRANSMFPEPGTPEAWPAYLAAESAKWAEVIRTRNITVDG